MSFSHDVHGTVKTSHAKTRGLGRWHAPKALVTPGGLPVTYKVLSHIMFSPFNAIPDENQSPEESLSFPLSNFNWLEHLAVAQVPVEWLGSHQTEHDGVIVQGDVMKYQVCY